MTAADTFAEDVQRVLDQEWCVPLSTNPPTQSAVIMAQALIKAGYVHRSWAEPAAGPHLQLEGAE